ncbi:MAG: type IV toxin-antitoxin system AbiEi family antitoxin [Pseudobdellovibrio sp.]
MNMESQIELNAIRELKRLLLESSNIETIQEHMGMRLSPNYRADAYLTVKIGGKENVICVEVKGQVNNLHQIKNFLDHAEFFKGLSVIVAEEINTAIKKNLKERNVGFLELRKELYLPISITLDYEEKSRSYKSAISSTGYRTDSILKLLFYFLCKRGALNYSQRQLSVDLGISLGAINASIKMLETTKIISTLEESRRVINNWHNAVEEWRRLYKHHGQKKILLGRFSPIDKDFDANWKYLDIHAAQSYWGGEPAANIETQYLQPEVFTIYTYESVILNLLKKLRLKKDPKGNVLIYYAFWPENLNNEGARLVPMLLTYCDLLNSDIDRNIETAREIERKMRSISWPMQ